MQKKRLLDIFTSVRIVVQWTVRQRIRQLEMQKRGMGKTKVVGVGKESEKERNKGQKEVNSSLRAKSSLPSKRAKSSFFLSPREPNPLFLSPREPNPLLPLESQILSTLLPHLPRKPFSGQTEARKTRPTGPKSRALG